MNIKEILNQKMQSAIEHFKQKLSGVSAGRAHPALLDGITVEVYGSPMRLRDIATISAPESRQLLISAFDPSNHAAISKAIEKSSLGLRAAVESGGVRIKMPELDTRVRQERAKQVRAMGEEAKIALRNIRRDCNELLKKAKAASEITEDILKRDEKIIQESTDKNCKLVDELTAEKERELLTV